MLVHKKIRANLNPEVEINEKDRNCYHLRWTYVKINPADPTHPVTKTEVRALRAVDYHRFFEGDTAKMMKMQKTVGVEQVELVHDPSLPQTEVNDFVKVEPQSFTKLEPKEVKPEPKNDEEKVIQAREAEESHIKARKFKDSQKLNPRKKA